jgi:hypothetical protein
MRERQLPPPMRMMLRDYFAAARRVHEANDDGDLLEKLTPLLQGTVALAANKKWLDHVWYFRNLDEVEDGTEFIAQLAKLLVVRAFVASERLPVGQLYILRRGFVVKMWRFLRSGKVWGEDMILESLELIDHSQAVALTYVEAYTLRKRDLMGTIKDFPAPYLIVKRAMRRMTLQRALLKYLCISTGKTKGPASFAPRSQAKGYTFVPDVPNLVQKVETILDTNESVQRSVASIAERVVVDARPHSLWSAPTHSPQPTFPQPTFSQPTLPPPAPMPKPQPMPEKGSVEPSAAAALGAQLANVLSEVADQGTALSQQRSAVSEQAAKLDRLEGSVDELKGMLSSIVLALKQAPHQAPSAAVATGTAAIGGPSAARPPQLATHMATWGANEMGTPSPSPRVGSSAHGSSPRCFSPRSSTETGSVNGSQASSASALARQRSAIAAVAAVGDDGRRNQGYWANRLEALRGPNALDGDWS